MFSKGVIANQHGCIAPPVDQIMCQTKLLLVLPIVKHKDNLRLEGKFEGKAEEKWYPADKPVVVKRKDNLKMEGDMEKRIIPDWAPG